MGSLADRIGTSQSRLGAKPDTVLVRVRSHRSVGRLKRLLGVETIQWFFTFNDGGNFAEIPSNRLDEARTIPGITLARPDGQVFKCFS